MKTAEVLICKCVIKGASASTDGQLSDLRIHTCTLNINNRSMHMHRSINVIKMMHVQFEDPVHALFYASEV